MANGNWRTTSLKSIDVTRHARQLGEIPFPLQDTKPRSLIWAVIVAFQRDVQLERLLSRVSTQTMPLAGSIVVDNANSASTAAIAAQFGAKYVASAQNLGGAGGFTLGILSAVAYGATMLWLWDDDGFPADDHCLQRLVDCSGDSGADVTSPLVVAEDDPSQTAFVFRVHRVRTTDRRWIQSHPTIKGFAHLFSGALIQASCLPRVGLPDYRLFLRGDEVDFFYRVRRSGGLIITCTSSLAYHPSGRDEIATLPGLPFGVACPTDAGRRTLAFRNRAYVFRRHHCWLYLLTDPFRYGAFFLIRRHPDWLGYQSWISATLRGWREQFGEPPSRSPEPTLRRLPLLTRATRLRRFPRA